MTDLTLTAPNGLTLGSGTVYGLSAWTNFEGVADQRQTIIDRPSTNGSWLGQFYVSDRVLTFTVDIRPDRCTAFGTTLRAATDALTKAWQYTADFGVDTHISFGLPGGVSRTLYGRPGRQAIDYSSVEFGYVTVAMEFIAGDPRLYGNTTNASLNLATATTGRGYNKSYNYGYGGGGSSGIYAAVNNGTTNADPLVVITGIVTNPSIINDTTGETIAFNISLDTGEFLVIDFAAKTVLLNGTESRYGTKSGTWFQIVPGTNNIRFLADASDVGVGAMFRFSDAYF